MTTITPTPEQHAAIKAIVEWYGQKGRQEFYLAGFAGVGKSTIVSLAAQEIKKRYKIRKVRTAAYTGKAASVLRRKGIDDAQTIHSLIYNPRIDKKTGELKRFVLDDTGPASEADLIVLDECSLVDEKMAADLRSFQKKTLVMGDPGQLPPIKGQGAFTSRDPDFFLGEIHRQAAGSPVLELATLARQGKPLPVNYKNGDVQILALTNKTADAIHNQQTQVICGLNKVRWTVTQRIRSALLYEGERPVVGERLICCKNNHEHGIFNGVMGRLNAIKLASDELTSAIDIDFAMDETDKPVKALVTDPYLFDNHFKNGAATKIEYVKGQPRTNEFDWAVAITCHKAQGSSWPHVTIIDDSASFRENQARWLYTSLTRAESGLTLLVRPS